MAFSAQTLVNALKSIMGSIWSLPLEKFFKEKDIIDQLKCPDCGEQLENPRILPCGQTYCGRCIKRIKANETTNGSFTCPSCEREHQTPLDGEFAPNLIALKILEKTACRVSRGKNAQVLANCLEPINMLIYVVDQQMSKPVETAQEYCVQLKNEVDKATEILIAGAQASRDEMMKKIDAYEVECLRRIGSAASKSDPIAEARSFFSKWFKYLNQFEMDDDELAIAIQEARTKTALFSEQARVASKAIFGENQLVFDQVSYRADNDLLGALIYRKLQYFCDEQIDFEPIDITKMAKEKSLSISASTLSIEAVNDYQFLVAFIDVHDRFCAMIVDVVKLVVALSTTLVNYRVNSFKTCACGGLVYFATTPKGEGPQKTEINVVDGRLKVLNSAPVTIDSLFGMCCDKSLLYCLSGSLPDLRIFAYDKHLASQKFSKATEIPPNLVIQNEPWNFRAYDGHLFFIGSFSHHQDFFKVSLSSGTVVSRMPAKDLISFVVNHEGITFLKSSKKVQLFDREWRLLQENVLGSSVANKRLIKCERNKYWVFDTSKRVLASKLD